mgnify:CR=1 FL=1
MGRYIGPSCRLCRREGEKLFLKGDKCLSPKCPFEKRPYPPGQHTRTRKLSDYGIRLREKQKVKRMYGVSERQMKKYFKEAEKMEGLTGENLLKLLEMRLDNVVYRLGFAESRKHARQLVRHGHFLVNGEKVDIPSYRVKPGDVIAWREKSKEKFPYQKALQDINDVIVPAWLELDREKMIGRVLREPERSDIDFRVDERLIVEFYSR